jgi:hypothetical protein
MLTLYYSPGQTVTLFLTTSDTNNNYYDGYYDGYLIDGYNLPVIHRIIYPNLTSDGYFPQPMLKYDTGIYYYKFILPTGAASVGTYFVDIHYRDLYGNLNVSPYLIQVSSPFGLYSATSF